MTKTIVTLLSALAFSAALCTGVMAGELKVAAASSTQDPLTELARGFERETHQKVQLVFGASGKFYTQLTQGAPFDVFFSADTDYPAKLYAQHLSERPRRYARGRIVLWALKASKWNVKKGLDLLKDPAISKVAIANPQVAPYGRAAVEAMKARHVYASVAGKLVTGENVSQAAQFAESGSVDLGILPLSLAVSPKMAAEGKYSLVPANLHTPVDADATVMASSSDRKLAERFLAYCTAPKQKAVWRRYGLANE